MGLNAAQTQALLTAAGILMGLGDVNGDGLTNQIAGNLIREQDPSVTLLTGSNEAAIENSTQQPIMTLYQYNSFGQLTETIDPEGNVTQYHYYSVTSPGSGSYNGGGYLAQTLQDTTSSPSRDSGTNPTPANITTEYMYDAVGNMTRQIDGRGIETDYVYNQLNEVVETISAAAVPGTSSAEPLPLTAFSYLERTFYDYNGNVVLSQVEDRGNTSGVAGNPPAADLPTFVPGALQSQLPRHHGLRRYHLPVRHSGRPGRHDPGGGHSGRKRSRVPDHALSLRSQWQPGTDHPARGQRHSHVLRRA